MGSTDCEFPNPKAADLIQEYAETTGLTNIKLSLKPGSAKGDNFVGIVFRVKIEGTKYNENTEMNVIVKTSPIEDNCRENMPIRELSLREIYVYTHLLPTYYALQETVNIDECNIYKFPKCYTVNSEMLNEFLVMEDLSLHSYRLHQPKEIPLDFQHVKIALETLARFHGLSYAFERLNPTKFQNIVDNIPEKVFNEEEPYEPMAKYFRKAAKDVLDCLEGIPELDNLKTYTNKIYENVARTLKPQKYSVLCHGDYWKNNMLFKYSDENIPVSAIPLDYQIVRYASPATDILYLIYLCTSQALRNEKYEAMINVYYDSLKRYLAYYSIDVNEVLPRTELDNEIKRVGSYALGLSIGILMIMTSSGEEIPDAATLQGDGVKKDTLGYKMYKERIYGVLQDCIKYGYAQCT